MLNSIQTVLSFQADSEETFGSCVGIRTGLLMVSHLLKNRLRLEAHTTSLGNVKNSSVCCCFSSLTHAFSLISETFAVNCNL